MRKNNTNYFIRLVPHYSWFHFLFKTKKRRTIISTNQSKQLK